jgi:hypothetical protein
VVTAAPAEVREERRQLEVLVAIAVEVAHVWRVRVALGRLIGNLAHLEPPLTHDRCELVRSVVVGVGETGAIRQPQVVERSRLHDPDPVRRAPHRGRPIERANHDADHEHAQDEDEPRRGEDPEEAQPIGYVDEARADVEPEDGQPVIGGMDQVELLRVCLRVMQREGGDLGEHGPDDTRDREHADLEDREANAGQRAPREPAETRDCVERRLWAWGGNGDGCDVLFRLRCGSGF